MPVASIARPISPPSASISRTRCPFAVPPTAGLHGMCATVSTLSVHNPTRTPRRAAAWAASQPAWPAPITITSNRSLTLCFPSVPSRLRLLSSTQFLFSETEPREDALEQIVGGAAAAHFLERRARGREIGEHELLGQRAAVHRERLARARERL